VGSDEERQYQERYCRSYGGNHDRFMKFVYKLPSDATTELMLLLNFLHTQFQATGFHHGLVPDIGDNHSLVDLTKSPVDATFVSNRDRPEWSNRSFWTNAHRELGFSLHRVLDAVSRDSAALVPVFARVVSEQSYGGNGFAVLNELLRQHFPQCFKIVGPSHPLSRPGKDDMAMLFQTKKAECGHLCRLANGGFKKYHEKHGHHQER
jgi:hypothetical protein